MTDSPNVFILTADSLSQKGFKDYVGNISAAVDGTEFRTAIATASDTNSAIPGLAAGVYSDAVPGWGLPESGGPTTLAEILNEEGYQCGLWSDNYLFGEKYNYGRGFTGGDLGKPSWKKRLSTRLQQGPLAPAMDVVESTYFTVFAPLKRQLSGSETFYEPAEVLHERALKWLDETEGPTLCWIHYMDTHHPYEPPASYLEGDAGSLSQSEAGQLSRRIIKSNGKDGDRDDLAAVKAAYDGTCRYLSDEVTAFISRLKRDGHFVPSRDVFVFTADHGECLDEERDTLGHVPPVFWEDIINVPLVVARPDWEHDVIDQQVSLIDMPATVLDALDLPLPESMEGESWKTPSDAGRTTVEFVSEWSPEDEEESMTTYRGVRTNDGKKLFGAHLQGNDVCVGTRIDTDTEIELYRGDPSLTGGPNELSDLAKLLSNRGGALESIRSGKTSDEVQAHLRDLGYVE